MMALQSLGMELSPNMESLIVWAVLVSGAVLMVWAIVSWVRFFIKLGKKDQNQNRPPSN
jgi:hypothetical protein